MSDTPPDKPSQVNPDDLMAHISNNSIVMPVVFSVVLHILVIGLTSIGGLIGSDEPAPDTTEQPAAASTGDTDDSGSSETPAADMVNSGNTTKSNVNRVLDATTDTSVPAGIDQDRLKAYSDTEEPAGEPESATMEWAIDSLE